jgi:hypothetical protein
MACGEITITAAVAATVVGVFKADHAAIKHDDINTGYVSTMRGGPPILTPNITDLLISRRFREKRG